ncbi:serine/threonine-protein phosphatase 6 regulatory ankyrin repeat subunit A-like protein [Planoprotostelium fungivorum]|uniref:Serine/threonine-protein phosphatase 6 regulatory ankyrin repeat subunit A-like protein n=1 Tax=Planoprotostelium fungivorum TaxID=1890364 RepID=A0A2P6NCF7_9EUKA|nr:serine/threonine-protein phosphatase 6 regulatory ankyrin repeat subunit A-like protein [Planoprotostelium fungivorum]
MTAPAGGPHSPWQFDRVQWMKLAEEQNQSHPWVTSVRSVTQINEKQRGVTPLFLACQRKYPTMIHYLLQAGADPNIGDTLSFLFVSPIVSAPIISDPMMTASVLLTDFTECKGVTPLYLCCLYGEDESVKYLLDYGANHSALCTSREIAPLHLAASKGIVSISKMLIDAGADVNIFSSRYGTPLHVAVSKNHQFILKLLLDHGASRSINVVRTEDGDGPLHSACRAGLVDIVKTLTAEGTINPYLKDTAEGNTALHIACTLNQMSIALHLNSKFPELIHTKNDADRQTPLFYANETLRKAIKASLVTRMQGSALAVNNKTFSDVRYVMNGGETIYGHKSILSLRCRKLMPPDDKPVHINNADSATFLALMTYVYTDRVPTDRSVAAKLIPLSDTYSLLRLKKLCVDATTNIPVIVPESTFNKDMQVGVDNREFSDVTFQVEGKHIHCHRAILMQHEYFRALLGGGNSRLREAEQSEITISEVSYEVFKALIHYCYTWDVIGLEADYVIELFQQANLFLLDGLRHVCEGYITKLIALDTVCQLAALADNYKSLFLGEACFDFMIYHYIYLKETPEYQELSKDLQLSLETYMNKRSNPTPVPKALAKDTNYSLL